MITLARVNGSPALPPLCENSLLRYTAFALLYLAQGVPYGLLSIAMPAWLAQRGMSAGKVGAMMGIVLLPWSLKLIAGPAMDRWSFLAMGRRRPWILAGQLGLMLSLFALAFVSDPMQNLSPLIVMGFVVNCFAATQDVAVDGMAIDVLPVGEQARANGIMWGAKMIGIAGTAAGSAWLLTHYGLGWAAIAGALVVAAIFCVPLILWERRGERLLPWSTGEASEAAKAMQVNNVVTIGRDLWRASIMPMSLLMGMAAFSFNVACGLFDAVMPVVSVQELGWKVTEFSNVKGMGSLVGGVFGMLIGGFLLDRFGRLRVMSVVLVSFIVLHASMSALSGFWHYRVLTTVYVLLHESFYTLITIAIFAVAMQLCWKRVAATQFTLYMTISNLGTALGSAMLGPLKTMGGYSLAVLVIAVAAAAVVLLLRFADLARHGVKMSGPGEGGPPATIRGVTPCIGWRRARCVTSKAALTCRIHFESTCPGIPQRDNGAAR